MTGSCATGETLVRESGNQASTRSVLNACSHCAYFAELRESVLHSNWYECTGPKIATRMHLPAVVVAMPKRS